MLLPLVALVPAHAIELQQVAECFVMPNIYCMFGEPALSPNGQCVVFTNGTTYPPWYEWWPGITMAGVAGGDCQSTNVMASNGNWHYAPAWSPDGAHLAFVSSGWDGPTCGLWTIASGDDASPATTLTQIVVGEAGDPAWSLDGTMIAYTTYSGICVTPSTGGGTALLVANGRAPSWGPDNQLVFERSGDLWIRMSAGGERQLTNTPDTESSPAWSPQGGWIAYASNRGGSWGIWVIAVTGGTSVRVSAPSQSYVDHPSWSARGDRIAYSASNGGIDSIWLATSLPEWTVPVTQSTWSDVKRIYR